MVVPYESGVKRSMETPWEDETTPPWLPSWEPPEELNWEPPPDDTPPLEDWPEDLAGPEYWLYKRWGDHTD